MDNLATTSPSSEPPTTSQIVEDTRVEFFVTGDDITAMNDAEFGSPDLTLSSQDQQFSLNGTYVGRTNAGAEGDLVTGVVTGGDGAAMDEAERERFNKNRTVLSEYDLAVASALATLQERMSVLEDQLDDWLEDLSALDEQAEQLDIEIAAVDEEIQTVTADLNVEQGNLLDINQQIAEFEEEQDEIDDDIQTETTQLETAEDNMEESRDELTVAQVQLTEAEAATEEATEQLEEAQQNPHADPQEIEELEQILDSAEETEIAKREAYEQSVGVYLDDVQTVTGIRGEIAALEDSRAENDVELDALIEQRDEQQIKIDALQAKLDALGAQKDDLIEEQEANAVARDELIANIAGVEAELDQMGEQLEQLQDPNTDVAEMRALLEDLKLQQADINAQITDREATSADLSEVEAVLEQIADNPELQTQFENGEITRTDILVMVQQSTGGANQVYNNLVIDNHNSGYAFTQAELVNTEEIDDEIDLTPRARSIQTFDEDEPELGAAHDGTLPDDEFQAEAPLAKETTSFDPSMYRESAMEILNDKLAFAFDEANSIEPDNFVETLPEPEAEPEQPENFVELRNAEPVVATPNAP